MRHNPEEFLGVDVGAARVGIARGSSLARIAQPLKTVPAAEAVAEIAALAKDNQVDGVVVGLPRSLEGKDTAQTELIRRWAKVAKLQINLPFYWQDEALTTKLAEGRKNAAATGEDAIAASIMLQDFLDTPEDERVRC